MDVSLKVLLCGSFRPAMSRENAAEVILLVSDKLTLLKPPISEVTRNEIL